MTRARLLREGLVLLLVLGVAVAASVAWQWWARNRTVAPLTPLGEQCAEEIPRGADRVTFRGAEGTTIGAASVGPSDARTAVLLRQGASQTLCDWLPWAADLAEETGARVLLFDRRGRGSTSADEGLVHEPQDLARAAALLAEDGADHLVLVASSMGNSVQLTALPLLEEPPCALVAISPVLSYGDDSGRLTPDPAGLPASAWPDRVG